MASELVGDTGLSEPSLYQNAPQEDEDDDLAARLPSAMAKRFPAPAAVSAAQLLNHPDFIDFASDSFDANSYASAVVHSPASAYYAAGGNISASLAKLNYNVEHLRKQVGNFSISILIKLTICPSPGFRSTTRSQRTMRTSFNRLPDCRTWKTFWRRSKLVSDRWTPPWTKFARKSGLRILNFRSSRLNWPTCKVPRTFFVESFDFCTWLVDWKHKWLAPMEQARQRRGSWQKVP